MGSLPQALQIIIATLLRGEDMHYDVAIIQEHPTIGGLALNMPGVQPIVLVGDFFNAFQDGFQLPFTSAGAQDEIVGDEGNVADVQQQDVLALLFGDGLYDVASQLDRFQKITSNLVVSYQRSVAA